MRCANCDYDLTGIASIVCPECGTDVPRNQPTLIGRDDARYKWAAAIGIAGWAVLLGEIALATARIGREPLALVCPGIPIVVVLASLVPWIVVLRRIRHHRSIADDLFVALFPWAAPALFALVVCAILFS
jgi:hypothetical protein